MEEVQPSREAEQQPGPEPEQEVTNDADTADVVTTDAAPADEVTTDAVPIGDGSTDEIVITETITTEVSAEDAPQENAALLKAVIEAAIYITDEPLTPEQISAALEQPLDRVKQILNQLSAEYAAPDRGLTVRELAGGYQMSTKPEHHESIRLFVKRLQPPLKLSLAALETLAVVAYKQPITAPEIMEVRGVQGAGVLKTLLDRKLIAAAGRKNVIGKPILYKTTREFLIQFGLGSLAELPTLKEFEELGRLALADADELTAPPQEQNPPQQAPEQEQSSAEPNLEPEKVDA